MKGLLYNHSLLFSSPHKHSSAIFSIWAVEHQIGPRYIGRQYIRDEKDRKHLCVRLTLSIDDALIHRVAIKPFKIGVEIKPKGAQVLTAISATINYVWFLDQNVKTPVEQIYQQTFDTFTEENRNIEIYVQSDYKNKVKVLYFFKVLTLTNGTYICNIFMHNYLNFRICLNFK